MKIMTLVRGVLLLAFLFALFVWAGAWSPVRAAACPPGQVEQWRDNPQTRQWELVCVPQQQGPVVNAPVNPLPPTEPSKWDQAPRIIWDIGPGGGKFDSPGGDATVTVPKNLFPEGTQLAFVRPPLNGLRRGTFRVRGAGDHIVDVKASNPSLDWSLMGVPGSQMLICFHISDQEVQDAGGSAYISIEGWNSSNWVSRLSTTVYAPDPPGQPWWEFCVYLD
ncbi:MAG: hypothetical protein HY782_22215 [Chloroflexi bacterium]|nr:hypothetical protein [Chloroflexota bacterium]